MKELEEITMLALRNLERINLAQHDDNFVMAVWRGGLILLDPKKGFEAMGSDAERVLGLLIEIQARKILQDRGFAASGEYRYPSC